MENLAIIKGVFSVICGIIAYWLGGYDLLLQTLISLSVLDFVSGVLGAFRTHSFEANKCGEGILNKIYIYIMVAVSVIAQRFLGDSIPIRETVIVFYIVYEGTSIIENIGKFVEYPEKIKQVFLKLTEGNNE